VGNIPQSCCVANEMDVDNFILFFLLSQLCMHFQMNCCIKILTGKYFRLYRVNCVVPYDSSATKNCN